MAIWRIKSKDYPDFLNRSGLVERNGELIKGRQRLCGAPSQRRSGPRSDFNVRGTLYLPNRLTLYFAFWAVLWGIALLVANWVLSAAYFGVVLAGALAVARGKRKR